MRPTEPVPWGTAERERVGDAEYGRRCAEDWGRAIGTPGGLGPAIRISFAREWGGGEVDKIGRDA